jgi:hypothetical protein
MMFSCPIEYEAGQKYIRQEMIELIKPHRQLLCFFAQTAGYRRGVLGLDFDRYDRQTGTVPVYVMDQEQAKIVVKAEGSKFKKAYRSSGLGKAIMVTFTSPNGRGWFKMRWELDEKQIMREE